MGRVPQNVILLALVAWVPAPRVAALGLAGLIYGRWLKIRSQQAMIDHESRDH